MNKTLCALVLAACGGGGGGDTTTTTTNPEIDAPTTSTPIDAPDTHSDPDAAVGPMVDANLTPATNDTCAQAQAIDITQSMSLSIPATTVGAKANLAAPCGTGGQPDVFFKFSLTRREMVYADTFGAGNNTLYFASACDKVITKQTTAGDQLCSSDACGTTQAQVAALLDPGTYYLVLAGDGATTLHFQHAQVGDGSVDQLPKGQTTLTGTTSGSGSLYACDAGGPENAYWWKTCPSDTNGAFTGSTCGSTSFDTIVSLQMPGTNAVMCDDDTCSFQSTVNASIPAGAGLYVLAVDGFSLAKHGTYTLTSNRP